MAQSREYPDLMWVEPRSWRNANRPAVQLIVIHTTEGSERESSAEDGAAYDARRTDGTSTHYFHDVNSTVQCVLTEDIAHAARTQGNLRGIQHELCGRAGQGEAGWADVNSQGTLRKAAKQCARDAKKWSIPVRHLTIAQIEDSEKGFCGHWDVTRAFPQDKGTHTDPGPAFPWTDFLNMVREEMGEDMPLSNEDLVKVREASQKGVMDFYWGATHAARGDAAFKEATPAVQRAWRQNLDTVRAVTGGPVSQAVIVEAIANGSVDEQVLAEALAPLLLADFPDGADPVTTDELVEAFRRLLASASDTNV